MTRDDEWSAAVTGSVWEEDNDAQTTSLGGSSERYEDPQLLGVGGMGRVEAVRDAVLGRRVALKRLKAEVAASSAARARLAREARLTARLEHPGIVPVYDAGVDGSGALFYTMRIVRGRSLAAAVAEAPDMHARLRLVPHVLAACQAVAYAHSVGVVHRDLKPANILVGGFGETQVVDWGLARVLDEPTVDAAIEVDAHPGMTRLGAVLGTPAYMAPEQARGDPADRRSDVFGLGRVLACVVGGDVDGPLDDAPPELRAIVARATAESPDERYEDAGALATDLAAWLEGRRVGAHDYSVGQLAWRVIRTWRAPLAVALAAAVALAVIGGLAWRGTVRERDRAVAAEAEMRDMTVSSLVASGREALMRGDRMAADRLASDALALAEDARARGLLAGARAGGQPKVVGVAPLPPCDARALSPDGAGLLCVAEGRSRWIEVDTGRTMWAADVAVDAAVVLDDAIIGVRHRAPVRLDRATGAVLDLPYDVPGAGLQPRSAGERALFVYHAELAMIGADGALGTFVAAPCGVAVGRAGALVGDAWWVLCADGTLVGAPFPGAALRTVTPEQPVSTADVAVGWGQDLVVGMIDGGVARLRPEDGAVRWRAALGMGPVRDVVPLVDRPWVVVVGEMGDTRVLHADTGAVVASLDPIPADHAVVPLPGGRLRIAGDRLIDWELSDDLAVIDVDVGRGLASITVHPDGGRWAVGDGSSRVLVADVATGALEVHTLTGTAVKWVDWDRDGGVLGAMAAGVGGSGAWWDAEGRRAPIRAVQTAKRGGLLPGDRAWVVTYSPGMGVFDLAADGLVWWVGDREFLQAAADPTGSVLLVQDVDGHVDRVSLADGATTRWATLASVGDLAIAGPEGPVVAAAGDRVGVYDVRGGARRVLVAPGARVGPVAVDASGAWVAAGGMDGRVYVWRVADGSLVAILDAHAGRVSDLAFSDDGAWLYTASWDHHTRRWAMAPITAP